MTTRADLSATEKDKLHPTDLMLAALEGRTEAVTAMLNRGAEVNAKNDEGRTALMFAVINLHTESVKVLLEHGADVNARDHDGETALMIAASGGSSEVVQMLLDEGADVSAELGATGKTALTLAEEHSHTLVVELLKSRASAAGPAQS